ncbi:Ubiquinone biosynthesis protein [Podosphaera aphanis]|nr:Ubiquinone biosynthesis protein [Podosphaera aphanis]
MSSTVRSLPLTRRGRVGSVAPRRFSVLHRPPPQYPGHVPLTWMEKGGLALGSALVALVNPRRGDLVAALGEVTASPYFIDRLRDVMLSSSTGRRILRERPRISSATLDMPAIRRLPPNTVGRCYAAWLDREKVSPDTRDAVQYVDDEECAYVLQRYRESHDFFHALTGLPVVVEGEIALKAFEFANTLLPMTGLSLFAITRLKADERARFWKIYLPWAVQNGLRCAELINVYWEEVLEKDVDELRGELGIQKPLDLRQLRLQSRAQKTQGTRPSDPPALGLAGVTPSTTSNSE